jgi:predicted ester cyclase
MSTEQNKALVHRLFEEGVNQNKMSAADEIIAPNYVNHDFPAPAPGLEGFKMVVGMFRAAFPDIRITIEDSLAEGDKVMTRGHFTGTHQGAFMGVPPTGKTMMLKFIDEWRFENGKAVENWVQLDMMGMMQQLGVIPTPGQAGS